MVEIHPILLCQWFKMVAHTQSAGKLHERESTIYEEEEIIRLTRRNGNNNNNNNNSAVADGDGDQSRQNARWASDRYSSVVVVTGEWWSAMFPSLQNGLLDNDDGDLHGLLLLIPLFVSRYLCRSLARCPPDRFRLNFQLDNLLTKANQIKLRLDMALSWVAIFVSSKTAVDQSRLLYIHLNIVT